MKALCIDCAVSKLTIAAKNDDIIFTGIYDIGMKQSATIVPSIEYAMKQVELSYADLDYTTLTIGPGSFTGLRIGISTLKAIELAYNVPIYGLSSLKVYSYPFTDFDLPVISVIDANKDKFYANISIKKQEILADGDYDFSFLKDFLLKYNSVFVCGPDANKFKSLLESENTSIKIITPKTSQITSQALFELAEKEMTANNPSLQDYDGPIYLRASEAEIKLNQ